jgi:hypothetical protein
MGAFLQTGDDTDSAIENSCQAYADDVALISETEEGMKEILKSLELFTVWSKMDVNVKKCATASYMLDQEGHRCTLNQNLRFMGQDIPNLPLDQSLKYLGTAVAARRNVKLRSTAAVFDEMKTLVYKVIRSPLKTVQKISAVKTFVIPRFDFMMLNGEVSLVKLQEKDSFIRGQFNKLLKIPGLPVDCHHMSWRDSRRVMAGRDIPVWFIDTMPL